jgi:hypothetical protein
MTPNVANDNTPDTTRLQASFAQCHGATLREQTFALTRTCVAPRDPAPPTATQPNACRVPSPLTRARMCA